MTALMPRDPAIAAYAWSRYRRVMRWLLAAAVALMIAALRLAAEHAARASVRRYVVAALVVAAAMLVGSVLMGGICLFRMSGAGENPQPGRRRSDAPE